MTGWRQAAAVYLDGRVIAVGFLGFSSGLPLLLTFSTLSVWLAELGVTKTAIGLFALVGLPYSIKFAWAPLIDRLPLPVLTSMFGRRRGWALATQALLIVAIVGLGQTDPTVNPVATAAWAVLVAFASASQDVVIDAYRVEILSERQQGAGAAMIVAGYRIGMLAAGAGALFLAEAMDWSLVYVAMAGLVGVGVVTVLLMPEPHAVEAPKGDGLVHWLRHAVLEPFLDFLRRQNWPLLLAFIVLYKFGDSLAGVMANPFYIEIGFSKAEIASVSKIFGLLATLAGGFLGGLLVARVGIWHSLLWAGVLQMGSNLMFAVQAVVGDDLGLLTVTIAIENLSGGMGTAAFVAYLSGLCNVAYTATQYALLSSFMSLARTTLSAGGGKLADETDWVLFFVLTTLAALPGLVMLFWLRPKESPR
ncbi:MAG: AmpG family muropeptide MFS transporter [Alphaproteobacteria bacterium]